MTVDETLIYRLVLVLQRSICFGWLKGICTKCIDMEEDYVKNKQNKIKNSCFYYLIRVFIIQICVFVSIYVIGISKWHQRNIPLFSIVYETQKWVVYISSSIPQQSIIIQRIWERFQWFCRNFVIPCLLISLMLLFV